MKQFRFSVIFIDFLAVASFTLAGMAFHENSGAWPSEFLRISSPFLIGILSCGWAFGAYDRGVFGREFVRCSAVALLVGLICSFFLRGMQVGHAPTAEFLIPSIFFFGLFETVAKGVYWRWFCSTS